MRIAFVAHGYPEREVAGVELVAREQAEALAARGHRLAVFARTRDPERADGTTWTEEVGGLRVTRVVDNEPYAGSFREWYDHHRLDAAFADFLAASRPDVVHVQHLVLLSPSLLDVARAAAIPCLISLHDAFFLCHRLFLLDAEGRRCPGPDRGVRCAACLADVASPDEARDRYGAMAAALAAAAAIVAPSPWLARRFTAEWPDLAARIRVVEPGLARLPARPAERRFGTGRRGDPLRLVFIGTWLPHKGLDLLIDAVLAVDGGRVCLDVYGEAVEGHEGWVQELRERSRGRVDWRGRFAPRDRDAVLAAADVLVLPSRCDESWSRVVREARAAGLAVVAPSTGGPADFLTDGVDALLVAPGDGAALRSAIARLVEEPALVARLAAAPAAVPTVAEAAARLEALYGEIA